MDEQRIINDREEALKAVKEDGLNLRYVSEELRNDKDVVLAAVGEDGGALEFASEELRNDREFLIAAMKQNGFALEYAIDELRNDKEVVLAAVKQDGRVLEYASDELQEEFKKDDALEPIELEGVEVDVSSFGFEKVQESDEIKFKNKRDSILAFLEGTPELYDPMLSDTRLSDDARTKLEGLKEEKINLIMNELTNQVSTDFDNLMDILVNPDSSEKDKSDASNEIQEIIKICRDTLKDDKMATDFEARITTLQDVFNSINEYEEVSPETKEDTESKIQDNIDTVVQDVTDEFKASKELEKDVDFSVMTNNELSQYLFDLVEKIKDAASRNTSDIPNDEVHELLAVGVRVQEEIDKRTNGIKSNTQEAVVEENKEDSSLESELDALTNEASKGGRKR